VIVAALMLIAAAGAPLDRGDFRYARPLGDVPPGLVSVVLDADALAHTRDLDDVRVVDAHDNQVPYVIEVRTMPVEVPLAVPPRTRDGKHSVYHFTFPFDTLPRSAKLELATSARLFERNVTLRHDARELQQACWCSTDPDHPTPLVVLDCTANDVDLVVDEGDNAPLPITAARLFFPGYAIRFTAPGGPLTLLYGAAIPPPHYDIALIAPRLLAQRAREIRLTAPPRQRSEAHVERKVFWIAIVVAVAVLLVVLWRLLVRA
jgi:hypothetical protein